MLTYFFNHKYFGVVALSLLTTLMLLACYWNNYHPRENTDKRHIIYSDGAGYYLHLSQWFIYDDPTYSFLKELDEKYPKNRFGDHLGYSYEEDNKINKYYPGTAVMLTPFFLIAHSFQAISGGAMDGYAPAYQILASLSALFYWLVGSIGLYLILLRLKIKPIYAIITITVISLGTNLFYYTISAPTFSHVYSYALINWIVLLFMRWTENTQKHLFLLFSLLLIGFAFVVRPTNIFVVLLLPFLFQSAKSFKIKVTELILKNTRIVVIGLVLLIIPILFLIYHNYNMLGGLALNSYTKESFIYLTEPKILEVLFSYKKGMFIYAPVLLFSLIGFYFVFKKSSYLFFGLLLTFSVFTYVTASWWSWWYGGGLGMRPFVEYLLLFAIPIAFLWQYVHLILKILLLVFSIGSLYLYQVYDYQINRNILHHTDMNKTLFWEVFLQTDARFEWHVFMEFEELPEERKEIGTFHFHKNESGSYELGKPSKELKWINNYSGDGFFGGKINGIFQLHHPAYKPNIVVTYFSDSSTTEKTIYFGGKFPSVDKSYNIDLELNPRLNFDAIDSIYFQLRGTSDLLNSEELTLTVFEI